MAVGVWGTHGCLKPRSSTQSTTSSTMGCCFAKPAATAARGCDITPDKARTSPKLALSPSVPQRKLIAFAERNAWLNVILSQCYAISHRRERCRRSALH